MSRFERILSILEWTVSGILFLACIGLNYVFLTHAGGFWRDEANSVQLALLPGARENWNLVWLDAHPVGYSILLKPFVLIRGSSSIGWLRWVGFFTCIGVFATFWLTSYKITKRPPLFFFALLVLNHYALRYFAAIRPYGVVVICLLLLLACCYLQTSRKDSRWPWPTLLLCAAVVNLNYASIVLTFVVVLGTFAFTWKRFGPAPAWKFGSAALLGLSCLLIYIPVLTRALYWSQFQSYPFRSLEPIKEAFLEVLETQSTPLKWIWLLVIVLAPLAAILAQTGKIRIRLNGAWLLLTWLLLPAISATMFLGKTTTAPWYFLPALALFAWGAEALTQVVSRRYMPLRCAALLLVVVLAGLTLPMESEFLELRQTNMDLVAQRLNSEVTTNDLVVLVNPLHGVSFSLYYSGSAPWYTVPPIGDHRIHRFDLIKSKVVDPDALTPLLKKIRFTLANGGRTYLVGAVRYHSKLPDASKSMPLDMAMANWSNQLALYLGEHAGTAKSYQVEGNTPMFPYENPPLLVVQGWR